jgi:hypothetical protein
MARIVAERLNRRVNAIDGLRRPGEGVRMVMFVTERGRSMPDGAQLQW